MIYFSLNNPRQPLTGTSNHPLQGIVDLFKNSFNKKVPTHLTGTSIILCNDLFKNGFDKFQKRFKEVPEKVVRKVVKTVPNSLQEQVLSSVGKATICFRNGSKKVTEKVPRIVPRKLQKKFQEQFQESYRKSSKNSSKKVTEKVVEKVPRKLQKRLQKRFQESYRKGCQNSSKKVTEKVVRNSSKIHKRDKYLPLQGKRRSVS